MKTIYFENSDKFSGNARNVNDYSQHPTVDRKNLETLILYSADQEMERLEQVRIRAHCPVDL